MLIGLLIGWLFFGGHGGGAELWFFGDRTPKQISAEVAKVVPDAALRNVTDYNLSLVEKAYRDLQSQRSSLEKDVLAALERHDTPATQFQTLTARADEINASATKTMLDVRFLVREQLSEAQWRALFPPPATQPPK